MIGPDDLRAQTWQTIRNIETAIKIAGGTLADIVSMRIYILEEKLEESHHIREALKEFFPQDRAPTTTWIGVRALANKEFLIEIEATGVIEK
jgi:enamine deaminase RidA (YjgF/YER057c/UK114 family)